MYSEQEDMRNRQDQGVLQYPNCLPVGFWCECVHLGFFLFLCLFMAAKLF